MLLILERRCAPYHSQGCFVGILAFSLPKADIDGCCAIQDEAYRFSVKGRRSVVNSNTCTLNSVNMHVMNSVKGLLRDYLPVKFRLAVGIVSLLVVQDLGEPASCGLTSHPAPLQSGGS